MPIIEVKNLRKQYKDLVAVDNVSFHVEAGEIFGFLGPNGAGKSTSINMLSTILSPTSGDAIVNGYSILTQRDDVRRSIGLVFQDPSLDDRLTAEENLRFHAELYGVPKSEYHKRREEVLDLVDLSDRRDDVIRTFSGGMRRRLEIARGLIHYPAILFLDEPTIGLDPQTRAHLWEYILRLKREKGMTIFLTTHYMNEAEYCDRIAIIDHGTIVALDTPEQLKKKVGGNVVRVTSKDLDALRREIESRYALKTKTEDGSLVMEVENGGTFLPRLFNELDTKIDAIDLHEPTLDDVFLSITGKTIRHEDGKQNKDYERMLMQKRHR